MRIRSGCFSRAWASIWIDIGTVNIGNFQCSLQFVKCICAWRTVRLIMSVTKWIRQFTLFAKILAARSNKRHSQETYVGCLVLFKVEHLSSTGGNIIGSRFLEEFCLVHIKVLKILFIFWLRHFLFGDLY